MRRPIYLSQRSSCGGLNIKQIAVVNYQVY